MDKLSIHLFGTVQIQLNQQPFTDLRSDKVRALLAYLIVERSPIARHHLVELLWHGYEPAAAHASLRSALSNLRRFSRSLELLKSTRKTVHFHTDHPAFFCDLLTLEGFLQQPDPPDPTAWQKFAPMVQRNFLEGLHTVDSAPFQCWREERTQFYQQQITQYQQRVDQQLTVQRPRIEELWPSNLARPLTPFIGREQELAELSRRVLNSDYPLITVVGEGGVGKTRLALAVVEQTHQAFVHGVYLVALSELSSKEDDKGETAERVAEKSDERLALAIGMQLKLRFHAQTSLSQQIFAYLRTKRLLLILDSFEHFYERAEFIIKLLEAAPLMTILITSRRRLDFQAELVFPLEGLAVPTVPQQSVPAENSAVGIEESPSVQLFIERATRTRPTFRLTAENIPAILQICRFVHGLPLALVLAAAQLGEYTCAQIADRLQEDYHLLATNWRDLPLRQRSMQSVLTTSWRLLSPTERKLLMQCTVFRGGFTVEAACLVTDAPASQLNLLETHSLLQQNGPERYQFHEMLISFVTERLAVHGRYIEKEALEIGAEEGVSSREKQMLQDRHAAYYLSLLADWQLGVTIEEEFQRLLLRDLENVHAAWQWALTRNQIDLLTKAYEGLFGFYQLAGLYREAKALLTQSTTHLRQILATMTMPAATMQRELAERLLSHLLLKLAICYNTLSQSVEVVEVGEEVLYRARELAEPILEMGAYRQLANAAWVQGNYAEQHQLITQALRLAQEQEQISEQIHCYTALGLYGSATQTYAAGLEDLQIGLALARQHNYRQLELAALNNLGIIYRDMGDFSNAMYTFQQKQQLSRHIGIQRESMLTIANLGALALLLGDYPSARTYYSEALAMVIDQGERRVEAELLALHAILLEQMDKPTEALRYCTDTLDLAEREHFVHPAREAWMTRGHIRFRQGALVEARNAYEQANRLSQESGIAEELLQGQTWIAATRLAEGDPQAALHEVTELLPQFDHLNFNPFQSPQQILLLCYQILAANADPGATALLHRAWRLVQTQAEQISDPRLSHSFLTNVRANSEIITLYAAQSSS